MDKHQTRLAWVLIWIVCGLLSVPMMKGCLWEVGNGADWVESERMRAGQAAWIAAFFGPVTLAVTSGHAIIYKCVPMMEFPEQEVPAVPERRRTF